jgi:hypothetical protein
MEFKAIVVSSTAEYLVTEEEKLEETSTGYMMTSPYVFNSEGDVQVVESEKTFVPNQALEAIHYGSFEEETVTKDGSQQQD